MFLEVLGVSRYLDRSLVHHPTSRCCVFSRDIEMLASSQAPTPRWCIEQFVHTSKARRNPTDFWTSEKCVNLPFGFRT